MTVRPLPVIPIALAIVLAWPLAGAAGEASEPAPEGEPPAQSDREEGPLLHGMLELTLADALEMGLENNLTVEVERFAPMIADMDERIAWGAYDPTLFGEFQYTDVQRPNANLLFGTDTTINRETLGRGGLQGIVPLLGTEYEAAFEGSTATTNSGIQSLSPEHRSNWSLQVNQPLLRDLIWNQPWTQVRTSRILLESSEEAFRQAVMDVVQGIEDAYWALIAREEALRVAQKSLETTRALLDQTQTQYEVGVVSKVEVTEAEAGLAQRQVELIRARNQYRNQQDVLIDRVLGPNLRARSSLEIRPTDRPGDFVPYEVDVEAAVRQAFQHRPEILQAEKEIERQRTQLAFRRNQILPELDGFLTFGQEGLSGRQNVDALCSFLSGTDLTDCQANPQDFSATQGNFGENFDDYSDSPTFVGGARFSIPFPNTVARRSATKTELEMRRAKVSRRRLEQRVIVEVRQAARNLLASQEGIVAARSAQRAAEEQLRAEEIRLEYGESTPFEVLQREEDLVDRERQLIDAFQGYRTSVTALDRAQGTILRNRNIKIADVAPLR